MTEVGSLVGHLAQAVLAVRVGGVRLQVASQSVSDRDVSRAVNEGNPVATTKPRSDVAVAFKQLAQSYLTPSDGSKKSTRKLFRKKV